MLVAFFGVDGAWLLAEPKLEEEREIQREGEVRRDTINESCGNSGLMPKGSAGRHCLFRIGDSPSHPC